MPVGGIENKEYVLGLLVWREGERLRQKRTSRIEWKLAFYPAQKCFIFNATLNRLSYLQQCVIHSRYTRSQEAMELPVNKPVWPNGVPNIFGSMIILNCWFGVRQDDHISVNTVVPLVYFNWTNFFCSVVQCAPPLLFKFFSGACLDHNELNAGRFNYLNRNKSKK